MLSHRRALLKKFRSFKKSLKNHDINEMSFLKSDKKLLWKSTKHSKKTIWSIYTSKSGRSAKPIERSISSQLQMIMLGITGGSDQRLSDWHLQDLWGPESALRKALAILREYGRLGSPKNLIPKAAHRMMFHLTLNFKIEAYPRTLKDMWEEARSFSLIPRSGLWSPIAVLDSNRLNVW